MRMFSQLFRKIFPRQVSQRKGAVLYILNFTRSSSALSVNGKLWMASDDISTNTIGTSFAVLFNKDLLETYKLEDPYALVDSGK